MIKLLREGSYRLTESKGHSKLLTLDNIHTYAWLYAKNIGDILVSTQRSHKTDYIMSTGRYRMYQVSDDRKYSDHIHLELHIGKGMWQGYILPKGLPSESDGKHRIIATEEIITKVIR